MKILLVEDEESKRRAISEHVRTCISAPLDIVECESLRGGLREIISGQSFDLILLDMSMPVDASDSASTFEEHEGFAGKELLAQMKLRDISMPVVVITQYKAFAKGTVDLRELTAECAREFPGIFQGAIYYSTSVESWKRELFEIINRI